MVFLRLMNGLGGGNPCLHSLGRDQSHLTNLSRLVASQYAVRSILRYGLALHLRPRLGWLSLTNTGYHPAQRQPGGILLAHRLWERLPIRTAPLKPSLVQILPMRAFLVHEVLAHHVPRRCTTVRLLSLWSLRVRSATRVGLSRTRVDGGRVTRCCAAVGGEATAGADRVGRKGLGIDRAGVFGFDGR